MATLLQRTGALLRATRKAQGVTLVELGTLAGMTAGTISQIETGKANTTLDTVERLFSELNQPIELATPTDDPFVDEVTRLAAAVPEHSRRALLAFMATYVERLND